MINLFGPKRKKCSKCGLVKSHSDFYKDSGSGDGRFAYCKQCASDAAKVWQAQNPERVLENVSTYGKNNPELRRIIGQKRYAVERGSSVSTLTSKEWKTILEEFDFLCVYCGAPWEHQDHFIPLSKGGTHTADNVVPACAPCNLSKAAKMPMDFINSKTPNLK